MWKLIIWASTLKTVCISDIEKPCPANKPSSSKKTRWPISDVSDWPAVIMRVVNGLPSGLVSISLMIFWSNSNFYKNSWPHRLYKTDRITTKSCTYQDSTAVLVCVTIHCDWIYIKGNIHKHIINFTNQFIFYKWDGYLGWPAGDYMVLVLLHHISNHFIRPQIFLFQSHSTNHCVKIRLFC